jgi:hypothetical protein
MVMGYLDGGGDVNLRLRQLHSTVLGVAARRGHTSIVQVSACTICNCLCEVRAMKHYRVEVHCYGIQVGSLTSFGSTARCWA